MDPYAWSWNPEALLVVPLLTAAYLVGIRRYPATWWRVACFLGAMALLVAVSVTPVHTLGMHFLLTVHLLQNVVLAVQNTVSVHNVGAASSVVAFFRTFGGAIGVSVLGSVLATRITELTAAGFAKLGLDSHTPGGGGNLNLATLPEPVRQVIRASYGDATGRIFLIAAVVSVVTLIAVSLLPNKPLRTTIDLKPSEADQEYAKV